MKWKTTRNRLNLARSRSQRFFGACLAMVLSSCTSVNHTARPISTNLSISTYSLARERAGGAKNSGYYFPLLEIYNDAGILLYSSHDSANNSTVIKRFPESFEALQPQQHAPGLKNVLAEIPAFREKALDTTNRRKWTIISTELDGCKGCTIQAQVLQDSLPRLTHQQSVEIFEIHVSPP
jgi:hypothetical protein